MSSSATLTKLTLCAVLVLGREAVACDCMPSPPPDQAFADADAVFRGTVVAVQRSRPERRWEPQFFVVRFKVRTAWKGVSTTEIAVGTGAGGGDCGKEFEPGVEYLVYAAPIRRRPVDSSARSVSEPRVLETHICTRTARLSQAGEDLRFLKSRKPLSLTPTPRRREPTKPKG